PDLHFDFPIDFNSEPDQYLDASVVNLFYWNNYMHDFAYHFGFTEEAGNFQQNNYGKGGVGDDAVNALAQQGANTGNKNNAYFTANLDGTPGHMAVYVFKGSKEYLTIKEPAAIAGRYKTSLPSAGWGTGSYVNQTPVSGEVVAVNDGVESPYATDACDPILNASALAGKIALITRGGCQFGWKALQLQNAGAIGIICCNFDDNDYTMNPGTYGAQVHIPIIMIGLTDTQTLTPFIGNGLKATLVDPGQQGPEALDGDFDGGMIAHEYGHGISRRLVGGPNTFCLSNAENMGEGWSDFIMLAVTAQQGDSAKLARGFCTYGFNQPPTGAGYRRHAYSTDMSINPLTYGDVAAAQETHDMGEIWGSTLWEMYWGLVDQYGWSANPYDESSGNFRAIKLVFEGLKNTPCSPGYVDGRNAILAADETLYNGEDICTIWKAFAKRGIGYSADQGSPDDAGDQKEAFDLPPTCSNSMLLKKSVTDFIQPGENIDVTLQVGNYKSNTVSGVRVTDEIPSGTQYKSNSANVHATIEGNHIVFDLGNLPQAHDTTITYTLETRIDQSSSRIFMDSVNAASAPLWKAYTYGDEVSNTWTLTETYPGHSGQNAWNALETSTRNRQILELNADAYAFHVEASHPVLRFYHRYQTKAGSDGGIVEVSEVGTNIWKTVEADMIRNGYSGKINYLPFAAPDLKAFYGNSGDDYKATYIDLSAWAGKDIVIRFRFGTDLNTNNGFGWLIDDIEFMDMLAYDGEACVTSDQGDQVCAIAPEGGTIVDSREGPLSAVPGISNSTFNIFPNPANDEITVVSPDKAQPAQVNLITLDGKLIRHIKGNMGDSRALRINTQDVPSGMYLIQVVTAAAPQLGKVIVEH
ncbi:MAG TPA: M36 family metallopeptidase, partial [Saprospiraceae bacterium]|nr:M36 family metallopeptidase [Saprospiraceae bacterium]